MASEDLKRLVAREIASGERIAEIARRHGYTWKGMKKLVESPDVRRLIAGERQAIDQLTQQHRTEMILAGTQAVENIRKVVENPNHPRCLDMSRFVVEKILPSRHSVEADVNAPIDVRAQAEMHEVMINMIKRFGELQEVLATQDPMKHVKTGAEALPQALRPRLPSGLEATSPKNPNSDQGD
jgi:hypothetical protein